MYLKGQIYTVYLPKKSVFPRFSIVHKYDLCTVSWIFPILVVFVLLCIVLSSQFNLFNSNNYNSLSSNIKIF